MPSIKANQLKNIFLYFIAYSFIGWAYEVFLEVVVYQWGYSDRGVLLGPYCPVYGVGALIFLFAVYPMIRSKSLPRRLLYIPLVFLLCMVSATLLELLTSYLCEWIMGSWPWQTYSEYKYNFQARIALSPSLRFGLGGVIFLYLLQPLFEWVTGKMGYRTRNRICTVLAVLFALDMVYTFLIG